MSKWDIAMQLLRARLTPLFETYEEKLVRVRGPKRLPMDTSPVAIRRREADRLQKQKERAEGRRR